MVAVPYLLLTKGEECGRVREKGVKKWGQARIPTDRRDILVPLLLTEEDHPAYRGGT